MRPDKVKLTYGQGSWRWMSVFLLSTKCSVKPCPSTVYDAHDLRVRLPRPLLCLSVTECPSPIYFGVNTMRYCNCVSYVLN